MNATDWYGFDNDNHCWYYLGKYTCFDDVEYDHDVFKYGVIKNREELESMITQLQCILSSTERVP